MTSAEPTPQIAPPYTAFKTFKNFLGTLKKTAVPPVIDTSMMATMSGSAQGQIKNTLRFFNLTTPAGVVTPQLRTLIAAHGTDRWQELLTKTITDAYKPVLNDLDVENATLGQLMECLKTRGGVNGSALRKATRFFLDAAKDAGMTVSPHFAVRGLGNLAGQTSRTSRKSGAGKAKNPPDDEDDDEEEEDLDVPEDYEPLRIMLPGRTPVLFIAPTDLSDAEWDFIKQFITSYRNLRA